MGESQLFRERTLSVSDKVRPGQKSNPRPSTHTHKARTLSSKLTN
jgi:hypothetical protein